MRMEVVCRGVEARASVGEYSLARRDNVHAFQGYLVVKRGVIRDYIDTIRTMLRASGHMAICKEKEMFFQTKVHDFTVGIIKSDQNPGQLGKLI